MHNKINQLEFARGCYAKRLMLNTNLAASLISEKDKPQTLYVMTKIFTNRTSEYGKDKEPPCEHQTKITKLKFINMQSIK